MNVMATGKNPLVQSIPRARAFACFLAFAAVMSAAPIAQAQSSPADGQQGTALEFTVAPYLLVPTMSGNVTLRGRDLEVDLGPSEIFENLEFGIMGYFEVRKGPWAFAFDGLYMDLGKSAQLDTILGPVGATLGLQQGMYELSGIRTVTPWADVVFGVRINSISGSFETLLLQLTGDSSATWVDPFVGVKLVVPETGNWLAAVRIDIGGFGVGSSFAWQIYPTVGYNFVDWFTLAGGFRILDMKYETGEGSQLFVYDMSMYGPFVGFVFHF